MGAQKTRMLIKNVDSKGQAHKVSIGSDHCIKNWSRGHACFILIKRLLTLCAYAKTNLERRVQGSPNVQPMAWIPLDFSHICVKNQKPKITWSERKHV